MKLISAFALTALSFVGLACASDSSPQTTDATDATDVTSPPSSTNPPGTNPPGTDPPGTNPPETGPPGTDAPADPELPAEPREVDDGAYETIKDLGDSSELIVLGTVTDESSLGRPLETNDPSADEYLGLTISVESVLNGDPIAEVLIAWDAYTLDADGQRLASIVTNGIPVPHVGDQLLLFLRPVDDQFASLLHGFPTHTPVALDGIGFVEAGSVSISDSTAQNAAHLVGKSIDQITELL